MHHPSLQTEPPSSDCPLGSGRPDMEKTRGCPQQVSPKPDLQLLAGENLLWIPGNCLTGETFSGCRGASCNAASETPVLKANEDGFSIKTGCVNGFPASAQGESGQASPQGPPQSMAGQHLHDLSQLGST